MKRGLMACVLVAGSALVGCADTSGRVFVAPSAHHLEDRIRSAAGELNDAANMEVFTVELVDSEKRVDDGVVLRVGELDDALARGESTRSFSGVFVDVIRDAPDFVIAHELCHAAGLPHVKSKGNLMNKTAPRDWTLTEEQLDTLRNLF